LSPPWRRLDWRERIVVSALHAIELRARERDRKQRRQHRGRETVEQTTRLCEMIAGPQSHLGQSSAQFRRRLSCRKILTVRAMPFQNFNRNIKLAARRVNRESLEQAGNRVGETGMKGEPSKAGDIVGVENAGRELDDRR
jgi:hypothetical protein